MYKIARQYFYIFFLFVFRMVCVKLNNGQAKRMTLSVTHIFNLAQNNNHILKEIIKKEKNLVYYTSTF